METEKKGNINPGRRNHRQRRGENGGGKGAGVCSSPFMKKKRRTFVWRKETNDLKGGRRPSEKRGWGKHLDEKKKKRIHLPEGVLPGEKKKGTWQRTLLKKQMGQNTSFKKILEKKVSGVVTREENGFRQEEAEAMDWKKENNTGSEKRASFD